MRTPSRSNRSRLLLAVALAVLTAVPIISFGPARWTGPFDPADRSIPSGRVEIAPAFTPSGGVVLIGPIATSSPLEVAVALSDPAPAQLAGAIALEYTPGTPEYGHYLTASQVADRFGPSGAVYGRAVDYFRSEGLTVTTSPDRLMLLVEGGAGSVGSAFGTTFDRYASNGRTFYSHPTPATLPSGIPWAGAIGLGNATALRPLALPSLPVARALPTPSAGGCAVTSPITPCLAAKAYNLSALLSAGDNGTGYTIGVVDAYDSAETQSELSSDLTAFSRDFSLAKANVSYVYPVPTTTDLNSTGPSGWATEEALDLEWSHALAPGASIDMTFAPNPTGALYDSVDWLVSHQAVNVLTMSWGENDVGLFNSYNTPCSTGCNASADGSYTILHPVLEDAAAEGISVFSATGDCGASDGTARVTTNYPASDPYVTAVGATDLTVNSTGGYASEAGWTGNHSGASAPGCENQGGSGGGFSPFPRPYWQTGDSYPTSKGLRGTPDVSILGGSPDAQFVLGGSVEPVGGTSLSSPMWAGIAADADSRAKAPIGFLNPSLYEIARSSQGALAFHDVVQGWNGYNATKGWDPVTGIGTPNAGALLPLLTSYAPPRPGISVRLNASPRLGASPLNVTLKVNATGGSGTFAWYDVDFGDGNSTLSPTATVVHRYQRPGVFPALAVAFDSAGNSSVSVPIAVVVGGGGSLSVNLSASSYAPAVGASVTFTTTAFGGTGPYSFLYEFGDGSYLDWTSSFVVHHTFGASGSVCASVLVSDAVAPPDGAAAPAVAIAVGGATRTPCVGASALRVSVNSTPSAEDLPGDLQLSTSSSGGVPPYGVTYASSDPYANACHCGIFSRAGNETVTATVADSVDSQGSALTNVTLYPAIVGRFAASALAGPAPWTVNFTATVSGGHGASAGATNWTFGDGATAVGGSTQHTYTTPGIFVAIGLAADAFGGRSSEAFLIDVYGGGAPPATVVSATVAPAIDVSAGTRVNYSASVSGALGPYTVYWALGENASASGANVSETYGYQPCLASGACPMPIGLTVVARSVVAWATTFHLSPEQRGNSTALLLTTSVRPTGGSGALSLGSSSGFNGSAPFTLQAYANVSGMPLSRVSWSSGAGANATLLENGNDAAITYLAAGNFTLQAIATDPYGDRLLVSRAVEVTEVLHAPPVVLGGADRTSGLGPLTVRFNVSATGGSGGPYSFSWAFGDGASEIGPSVSHVYAGPGNFTANVTATDSYGSRAFQTFAIVVYAPAPVDLRIVNLPSRIVIGTSPIVELGLSAQCGNDSLPHCGTPLLPLNLSVAVETAAGAPYARTNLTDLNPFGDANVSVTSPGVAGDYRLVVAVISPGYDGRNSEPFSVVAPAPCSNCSSPPAPIPWLLWGVGAAGAAAALVALGVGLSVRRRRAGPGSGDPSSP